LLGCKPNPSVCSSSFPGPKCTGMVRWPILFLLFIYSFYSNFQNCFYSYFSYKTFWNYLFQYLPIWLTKSYFEFLSHNSNILN
jgi:hypothetical protein